MYNIQTIVHPFVLPSNMKYCWHDSIPTAIWPSLTQPLIQDDPNKTCQRRHRGGRQWLWLKILGLTHCLSKYHENLPRFSVHPQNVWSHTPWNDKPHLAQQIEAPKHCRQCPEKRRRSYWSVLPKCMSSLGHFFGDLNGTWLQFTKQNQWQDILLMEEPCTTWHI